jgi:5-methylcytosine-specific restriction enzyme subunit McrC
MTRIELRERQASDPIDLDAAAVAGLMPLEAYVKLYVGAFRAGRTDVWIRPKVSVSRLLYLLGFSEQDRWWDIAATLGEADHVVPAMTMLFVKQADRAIDRGAHYGYRQVDVAGPALRGRLREADHMRRRRGLALPVEVRLQEHTLDVPENQLLLTAARKLQSLGEFTSIPQRRLHRCIGRLVGVRELPAGSPLPPTRVAKHNPAYGPALRLARLILADRSVEMVKTGTADTPVTGFLLNMETVFQDYLALALKRQFEDPDNVRPDHQYHLDPDVTIWREGACVAVLDAKYKPGTGTSFSADLNQVIVYCMTLGARQGHLVYVDDTTSATSYEITGTGIRVSVRSLNLDQDIPVLQSDIQDLAADLAAGPAKP